MTINIDKLQAVAYSEPYLEHSWLWLNDSEIKELTFTPDFDKNSQLAWFNSLKDKLNYQIWGIEYDNIPIGVFGIKNISEVDGEYWGYIGEKQYWGKGISQWMLDRSIEFSKRRKIDLYLYVKEDNIRAIRAYEKKGFVSKILTEAGLLRMEWRSR